MHFTRIEFNEIIIKHDNGIETRIKDMHGRSNYYLITLDRRHFTFVDLKSHVSEECSRTLLKMKEYNTYGDGKKMYENII